ncbi:putative hydrolase [Actinokineospora spheciospongiae]|uniref:Putative hydrolase n=1 Tax=Actinokineospora spheciospongiae TaxID=909613 RepID=W7ITD5_9PSEU|nr:alpha/beta hydrolase [Actinokineospora spheciospongiae]EWC63613.1 putative hydrolase [Actinokineospora spheciospongiae]PWW65324.1 pimeloyl-ACP methyl ester carboxylesterase [Actinokineospora spheciospongiae]
MSELVTSDGVRLNVVVEGPAHAPVTLVLLHGWTLDHTSWDEAVARLSGHRIVRFDLRGHGDSASAPHGSASIDRLADDLAEVVAAVAPTGPLVLGGHSMGGMTLMALAERHPRLITERVAGVAFVATTSGGLSRLTLGLPRWVAAPVLFGEKLVNLGLARARRPSLLHRRLAGFARPGVRWLLFGRKPRPEHIAATAAQVGRCNPANMVGFRSSLNEHERLPALAVYRGVRAVVLSGGRDRLCSVADGRTIADALPDAELAVYPEAGHMLNYERVDEVASRLARLLDTAELPRRVTA